MTKFSYPAQGTALASSGTQLRCAVSKKTLPRRLHLIDAVFFLITASSSAPDDSIYCPRKAKVLLEWFCSLVTHSWFFWADTQIHTIGLVESLLPSETPRARPPLSALLSTFVSSKLLQNNPLSSQHSVTFLAQSPSTILPKTTWSRMSQQHPTPGTNFCPS